LLSLDIVMVHLRLTVNEGRIAGGPDPASIVL